MNLDPQDAFFSQDVYQVAHDQGYRTALCGKNHTYKTAQGVDFWREYGHNKGYKAPGASADVAKVEKWMDELDFNVALEHAPLDRQSGVKGQSVTVTVDLGGRRLHKKKTL